MAEYVLLTRIASEAIRDPSAFEHLEHDVCARVERECPGVRWISSYAVLGPYDYVDVFEAPDNETAAKVAIILRSFGRSTTEIWPALPWARFRELSRELSTKSVP